MMYPAMMIKDKVIIYCPNDINNGLKILYKDNLVELIYISSPNVCSCTIVLFHN